MRNTMMSMMILLMLGIGSTSCDMGSNFDEVVVDNSVQDQLAPSDPDDDPKPGGGD